MLPLLPFERIAKKVGVKRVSKDALEELRDIVEEYSMDIAEKAVRLSRHADRRTVKEDDVEFVVKKGI
ncbi:MAG: histone family protein [Candidatus Aenigmatarchaeota archaeon]